LSYCVTGSRNSCWFSAGSWIHALELRFDPDFDSDSVTDDSAFERGADPLVLLIGVKVFRSTETPDAEVGG
jgi:hypothetical protein